jgi:hypothetical protein
VANVVPARPGGAMTSWAEEDDGPEDLSFGYPHVVYADANGNLHQIWSAAISGDLFYG